MAGLSGAEASLLEGLDAQANVMLAQVESWAAINSGSGNLPGLAIMADRLSEAFGALPGKLESIAADPVEVIGADGRRTLVQHGCSLRLMVRPKASLQLLFTGHMDTVFAADDPFRSCRWTGPGVLNGPGVADMKGGLAVMLAMLEAIERSTIAATIGYEVVINSDEEISSTGSAALIARACRGKTAAFTYEPAMPDGMLISERPGSGNFSCVVAGRAAHAGRNPQEGRNAVLAAADLALRLARAGGPDLKVNPARIDGGGPNNVVPVNAVLRVNLRPMTAAAQARATRLIDEVVAAIEAEHDVTVSCHGGFARPPKPVDGKTTALFDLVRGCGRDLSQAIRWKPSGGVCDGNNIAAQGVPVLDTMGVRGGAIHSPDEYLIVESLVERARLSALAVARLATGARI